MAKSRDFLLLETFQVPSGYAEFVLTARRARPPPPTAGRTPDLSYSMVYFKLLYLLFYSWR